MFLKARPFPCDSSQAEQHMRVELCQLSWSCGPSLPFVVSHSMCSGRPSAGQKLSLTLQPQRQAVIGAVQLKPEGGSTTLSATAVCGFGDKAPASKLLLDVLWQV